MAVNVFNIPDFKYYAYDWTFIFLNLRSSVIMWIFIKYHKFFRILTVSWDSIIPHMFIWVFVIQTTYFICSTYKWCHALFILRIRLFPNKKIH